MPDSTPSLLPCPFCGSADTDDVLYCAVDEYHRAYVTCSNCFAEGPVVHDKEIGSDEAIEQAAAAWNQRSTWQPIETEPRDGTKVLAWDGSEMQIGWTITIHHEPGVRLKPGAQNPHTFWVYTDEELHYYDFEPTHWQPLPSPPTTPSPHA